MVRGQGMKPPNIAMEPSAHRAYRAPRLIANVRRTTEYEGDHQTGSASKRRAIGR